MTATADPAGLDAPVRTLFERIAGPAARRDPDLDAIGRALVDLARDVDYLARWIERLGDRNGSLPIHAPDRGPAADDRPSARGADGRRPRSRAWVAVSPIVGSELLRSPSRSIHRARSPRRARDPPARGRSRRGPGRGGGRSRDPLEERPDRRVEAGRIRGCRHQDRPPRAAFSPSRIRTTSATMDRGMACPAGKWICSLAREERGDGLAERFDHGAAGRKQAVVVLVRRVRHQELAVALERRHVIGDGLGRLGRGGPDRCPGDRPSRPAEPSGRPARYSSTLLGFATATSWCAPEPASEDPLDAGGGISTNRPSSEPKAQTSISGGATPSLVRAVQIWLRWSVPCWTAWPSRTPSGARAADPSSRCRTTIASGSPAAASTSAHTGPLASITGRSSASDIELSPSSIGWTRPSLSSPR